MTPPKVRATFLGMGKRDTCDSIPKNCDCMFYSCLCSPYVWTVTLSLSVLCILLKKDS